ncbi:putative transporter [Thozetella sp. PMI_491]|nr:putative transporter [Thozetella sp. PMI_491]
MESNGASRRKVNLFEDMTRMTFLVALFGSLGGCGYGIDFGYWAGVLGMAQFKKDFGIYDPTTKAWVIPSSWQSAGSGAPLAGLAIGALLSGLVGNRLGRLVTFRVGSVSAVSSYWQITVGRVVNSAALGLLSNAIPAYLAECAPVSTRGALLVFVSMWGSNLWANQWAYRLPMVLQFTIPVVFIPGSFLIPESPRWLVGKGREADAQKALGALRSNTPSDVIEYEVRLIVAAEEENRKNFSNSWKECFKGPNLRRTLIATGVQCFQQAQGSSFMASYLVVFFQALNFTDVYKISVLFRFTMTAAVFCGFYIPDRVGRRWLMVICAVIMAGCLLAVAGIQDGSQANDYSLVQGALACLFIWEFIQGIGWESCVWIVTAEVPSLQLREKTITVATFAAFSTSLIITFVSPYIQAAIGAKIGFLWGGFSLVTVIWCLLFLPETGFRSLEELDELFEKKVSVWKFSQYQTRGFGAQLAEVETSANHGKADSEKVEDV